jgi:hypothetical protein
MFLSKLGIVGDAEMSLSKLGIVGDVEMFLSKLGTVGDVEMSLSKLGIVGDVGKTEETTPSYFDQSASWGVLSAPGAPSLSFCNFLLI